MKAIDYEKHSSLSKNSFWGVWSYLMVGKYIKDTCSLIWNTLFAVITLPLWIFPGAIINLKRNDQLTIPFWGISVINLTCTALGWVVLSSSYPQASIFIYYILGIGTILTGSIVIAGFVIISDKIEESKERKSHNSQRMNVLKTFFTDLKKKHCSLIHWE